MLRRVNDSFSRAEMEFVDDLIETIKENYDFYADEEITEGLVKELGMELHNDTNGNGDECVCWNVKRMGDYDGETIEAYATENKVDANILFQEMFEFAQSDNSGFLEQIGEECGKKFGFEMYQFGRSGGWFGFEETHLLDVLAIDEEKLADLVFSKKGILDSVDLDDYDQYDLEDVATLLRSHYGNELKSILHIDKDFVKFCDDAWESIKEESKLKGTKEETLEVLKSLGF